ncbi:MAG: type III-A CRISPR-associated RAMP protein Csm5 [Thermodesulfovibrio sp.]|nr:type III-A CRISPR-associated RAMP protein Csm5 [Thermodesulfovibrio sp.]
MIYNIRLHILSPVHIGCDQSYSPINFVIDTDKSILTEFDLWDFINSLNEKEWDKLREISENSSSISLVHLYRFYAERKDRVKGKTIPIPTELAERYRQVKQFKNEQDMLKGFNEFEIPKTFYNLYSGLPIIPGTSIKGSIRTAYVEGLLKEKGDIKNYRGQRYNEIEEDLLRGKIKTDPFKLLKVSDFEPEDKIETEIIFQLNVRKLNNISRETLSVPIEVIPKNNVFKGTISIEKPLPRSGIKRELELMDILSKTHYHYAGIFTREIDLKKVKGFSLPEISNFKENFRKKYFLLRIGKHSGAEAVTWEGLRQIKVRTREGRRTMESPTTIWLASKQKKPSNLTQTMPFGWTVLEVL